MTKREKTLKKTLVKKHSGQYTQNIRTIPFNCPCMDQREVKAVEKALTSLEIAGNGPISKKTQKLIQERFKVSHALLTSSCTHAMELALMTLSVSSGDEVILPSFTFVSTANAILRQGARPVFADVDPLTLNLSPQDCEKRITKKTKAIIPVHYAGVSCEMDRFLSLGKHYHLFIVEDAAQGVNALYRDKYLGTIGDIGCYSFHGTKNISCGEGGAFLTNNPELKERARILGEHGTDRSQSLLDIMDKYTWIEHGGNYLLSEIQSAILYEQLLKLDEITERRKKVFSFYYENLKPLEEREIVKLPFIPDEATPNWHIFYFRVKDQKIRDLCLKRLKQKGIEATFHYIPLHSSPFGINRLGYKIGDLPITEKLSPTLVRLPIYPGIKKRDLHYIVDCLYKVFKEI